MANNIDYVFTAGVAYIELDDLRQAFDRYSDLFFPNDKAKTQANIKDWYKHRQYEAFNMPTALAAISATRTLSAAVAQRIYECFVIPNYLLSTSQFTKQFNSHNEISDIIQQEAHNYLAQLANPQTSTDYQTSARLFEQVEQQGISAVWPHIQDSVKQRVLEETDYNKEAQDDNSLSSTITQVRDYTPFNMDPKKSLSQSKGYQAFCSQLISANAWLTGSYLAKLGDEQNAQDETLEDKPSYGS